MADTHFVVGVQKLVESMFDLDPFNARKAKFLSSKNSRSGFLFWSVVVSARTVYPTVCILGLDIKLFKHKGIGGE